jgi:trk system potassium uptake protein
VKYRTVLKLVGSILIIDAFLMLPALLIAFFNREQALLSFVITFILTLGIGLLLSKVLFKQEIKSINIKSGLSIVALGWIAVSLLGALPFYLSGSVSTFVDAVFETVSGFTTTGASIIPNVEILDRSILFWRSFTHWIGGMGILVFTLALLPAYGISNFQIFKAEAPGPTHGKLEPHIKNTARTLYITYIVLTLLEIIFLVIGGVSLYDSALLTFGTVGTGGFAPYNDSIAGFSTYVQMVISFFMVLAGINFTLYILLVKGKIKDVFADSEFKMYLRIIAIAIVLIAVNLVLVHYDSDNVAHAIRDTIFQVSSIITTTGYATVDFQTWPAFSKFILLGLMFVGGSSGSTAGGIKVIRLLISLKLIKREISKIFHPNAFVPIKLGKKIVPNEVVARVNSFIALHLIVFVVGTLLISLDNVDMITALSSVAATINNIGPGLELVGPTSNYANFSQFSKIIFSFIMLLGRLELFTIVALIVPQSWSKES